jgi:hypothetical protein
LAVCHAMSIMLLTVPGCKTNSRLVVQHQHTQGKFNCQDVSRLLASAKAASHVGPEPSQLKHPSPIGARTS